jgi:hypothetical protein
MFGVKPKSWGFAFIALQKIPDFSHWVNLKIRTLYHRVLIFKNKTTLRE